MGCNMNEPDCFNCPYEDCIASMDDIKRQWKSYKVRAKDNIDRVPKIVNRARRQGGSDETF